MVVDFGIARAAVAAGQEKLTQTGLTLGTPQYMSPEQGSAERNIDGRTDIDSLACVVYEMLAGQAPFAGTPRHKRSLLGMRWIKSLPSPLFGRRYHRSWKPSSSKHSRRSQPTDSRRPASSARPSWYSQRAQISRYTTTTRARLGATRAPEAPPQAARRWP